MLTVAEIASWLPLLVLGGGLLLLPGLALRGVLAAWAGSRDPRLGAPDGGLGVLLDGLGLSLALWPLLLLYADLLHIPFGPRTVGAVLAGSALVLAVLGVRAWRAGWRFPAPGRVLLVAGPLALLTFGALVVRFVAVRGLAVPQWGDSFHHTLITQLFLEQGGVPHGYTPYAPVYSFTYHFGFHGLAALWAWLSGQPSWSAVITVGQILSALALPAAYVLTRDLFRSRTAGLASAVLVGFLSGEPAEYVNWGRYTQLAGQVLLPFALVWFLRWADPPPPAAPVRERLPRLVLAVLGASGLGLTHYRVLIMYALFVLAYLAIRAISIVVSRQPSVARRQSSVASYQLSAISRQPPAVHRSSSIVHRPDQDGRGRQIGGLLGRALVVGVLGGVLFAPWFGNLLAAYLPGLVRRLGGVTASYANDYTPEVFLTQFVGLALPLLALAGAGVCLRWGPARARIMVLVLAAWTGLLALSARPDAVALPGVGAMGTFTIGIMLYLPLATLAGPGIAQPLLAALRGFGRRRRARRPPRPVAIIPALANGMLLLAAFLLALGNPGFWRTDPFYAYMTPDDLRVITWAGQHTPPGAQFLISAHANFEGRSFTATDAGMWLPLLTGGGRQTSVPPLSATAEGVQGADLARRVQALYTASLTPTLPSNVALLRHEGISYVFLGAHTATIPAPALLADPADYCLLTRQGHSYLFGVRSSPAAPCP